MDISQNWEPDGSPDSPSVSSPQALDKITILQTFGPLATKRVVLTPDGKPDFVDYDKAKHFRMTEREVSGFTSMAEVLDEKSQCKRSFLVRGSVNPGVNRERATRTLRDKVDPATGEIIEPATLGSVPRRWQLLDIDDVPPEDGMDIFDANVVIPYVASFLPPEFHDVSCRFSFTSGHGIKPNIRVRLAYWSSRALSTEELKTWLGERVWDESTSPPRLRKRWPVDTAVFSANQPNYISPPIFGDGVVDPVPVRSGIWRGKVDEFTPPDIDLSKPSLPVYQGTARLPGGGYDAYRALIGVDGFHDPIWFCISSYFGRNGAGADAQWLRNDLASVIHERGQDSSQIAKHIGKLDGMISRAHAMEADKEVKRGVQPPFDDSHIGQDEPLREEETAMPDDSRRLLDDHEIDEHAGASEEVEPHDPDLDDDLFPADLGPLNADTAPPEEYLVGNRLARSFVSLLVAPGATMKTSLQLLQAVAAITGRNLTGEQIHKRCRVWFVSNEEPIEVLRRRLWAICIQHNIDYEVEVRPFLFVNSTVSQSTGFEVVKMQSGSVMVSPDVPKVIRFAQKAKIDLMMVDPFISTVGGASENDNTMIDFATRQFSHIAAVVPLALELAHHVAKSEDCEAHVGNIARARGAGALVNKVRYSYTVAKTNDDTGKLHNLSDEERRRLVRFDMGDKNNYVLSGGGPTWFWLSSVELPNAKDGRANSSVGVPMLYDMDSRVTTVDPEVERRHNKIRDLLIVNIAGDDGRMSFPAFIKTLQKAAETDYSLLTATSPNSIRALIEDVIPEQSAAYEKPIHGGMIRLYRRKEGGNANSPIVLIKETTRGCEDL